MKQAQPSAAQTGENAFTLIELLVVTAMIAILASMLLPALGAAKQNAQRAKCTSNVHELSLANTMYVGDNNGDYPPRDEIERWPSLLIPYYNTTNLIVCPSETTTPLTYGLNTNQYPADCASRTYIINGFNDGYAQKYGDPNWMTDVPMPFLSEKDIPLPSATVLFGEKLANAQDFFMDYDDFDDGLKLDQVKHNRGINNTNVGGSDYGFIDGSTRYLHVFQSLLPVDLWCTTAQGRTNTAVIPD
jgi:prepilin-type N-terminal cleavage/methylation domain-containing protein